MALQRRNPTPVLSVVIPTFNAAGFLPRAIDSALRNSPGIGDLEVIVVDDGSTDATPTAVERYRDRICYYALPHCGLPGRVRNYGIERSHADVVAFLDADDECLPGRFDRQLRLLKESGADLVFCDSAMHDENGNPRPTFLEKIGALSLVRQAIRDGSIEDCFGLLIKTGNFINGGVMMIRRAALDRVGFFDPSIRIGEDFELATRIAAEGRVAVDFTPGVLRREHGNNISADWRKRWPDSLALYQHFQANPRVQSRPELRQSVRKKTAQVYRGMGSWHLGEGDSSSARQCWRRGMALDPLTASTAFWLMSFLPSGWLRRLQRWKTHQE
jgi:glycosyltransferase involved in cell wall biosynthesis